jgi:predicted O-methyltransferase YrrM
MPKNGVVRVRDRARATAARILRRAVGIGGFDLLRRNFYSPVPQMKGLPPGTFERRSPTPGIAWDMDGYESLLRDLAPALTEFTPPENFIWENRMYGPVESEILYALIRRYKPTRIVELGSGFSSLIIAAACRENASEGRPCRYVAFDPFPREFVKQGIAGMDAHEAIGATDVRQEEFDALAEGDILFIDTTHTVKVGGDVNRVLLEILPRLASGVLVHVHDIFLPYEYPRAFFEKQLYWQEQYLLQALLAENPKLEVLFPAYAVVLERPELIKALIPRHQRLPGPGAFWIRRRGSPAVRRAS